MGFSFFGPKQVDKLEVMQQEYSTFAEDDRGIIEALRYYEKFIIEKKGKYLNETQKALTYYYFVDGMINNSGVYSILLESFGEYNDGYMEALRISNNKEDLAIYEELVKIFNKYKSTFMGQELPPELDEGNEKFNEKESKLLESIEEKWYDNSKERDRLFKNFLVSNKHDLIIIKE